MNCNNFGAIISDLAREQMLDATLRESALLHMKECEACACLLETERALTSGLRSLAASMEGCAAPASLEASLLAKFRERAQSAQASPVVVEMPQRTTRWHRWYPHAVAAAVLLMFAIGGASMLRLRQWQTSHSQPSARVAGNSNKTETQAMAVSPDTTPASINTVEDATTTSTDGGNQAAGSGRKLSRNELAAIYGTAPRRPVYQSVPKSSVNEGRMTSTSGEIATDFMPVSYGDNLNEIDNGRIVRVEMPRSALAQFGLPVNMDRANERIKADVLIGDDGMARAIRFVR
jgi:hypothetical protein